MPENPLKIGQWTCGTGAPLLLFAGPCVIESEGLVLEIARRLKEMSETLGVPLVFKASYDKANRTSGSSFRGPGLDEGLRILSQVRQQTASPC